ncbi:hypothetical protein GCM10011579_036190 [Streptomyces albiflavescens]|uniref:Tat pathway signal sequence domain protein n=1 Tax=Streptomyces albiflavescens TaxID=1623582 RepID=A0A918D4L8_9ACTN|nr:hypothetical protein [Streptomyces albiflavescens]GGN65613.1 hypothetical protein GCM10011579_036190 [Streptomyces albiflavescens]
MTRIQKYVAATAVAVALVGAPAVSYAASQGKAASGTHQRVTEAKAAVARAAAKKTPTARIVAPGEHVKVPGGAEIWLTEEGKHWTTPENPEPQFRSVVDGNIDLTRPAVSLQTEGVNGHYFLSGLYYGGKGTASRVTVETKAGTVHGKLLELAGKPGWGVWYATAEVPTTDDKGGLDYVENVTVRTTTGKVYAQLKLN